MKAVVTGAAGFIGSGLSRFLLGESWSVVGVDCLTPYYGADLKRANLDCLLGQDRYEYLDVDLRDCDVTEMIDGADVVFHLAAQPGVRLSWDEGFRDYVSHNVLVTQRVLEAVRVRRTPRLVFASSSSVYGNATTYPTSETSALRPHSPYGVTKLAAENLCSLYADNWNVAAVSLRYFTVYGPRQRPDMAIHRLIDAGLNGHPFPLYGDGQQVRDFTYVDDVVWATALAGAADAPPGAVINIAGGSSTTMDEVIRIAEAACGQMIERTRLPDQPGDVRRTGGDIDRASRILGWEPRTGLADGIARQVLHQRGVSSLSLIDLR